MRNDFNNEYKNQRDIFALRWLTGQLTVKQYIVILEYLRREFPYAAALDSATDEDEKCDNPECDCLCHRDEL